LKHNGAARKKVDILVSGRGTNMVALILAALDPGYPAHINRVISSNREAGALELAEKYDIPAIAIDHRDFTSRETHEAAMIKVLDADKPDYICLAGFMRILSPPFVRRYQGRIINIHPSLLPAFPGIDTHERAITAGARVHGASVHFVTEALDDGPIIAQVALGVHSRDTPESLAQRVLEHENRLYPHALRLVAGGQIRLSGSRNASPADTGDGISDLAIYSPPLPC
jgi:phosphoribosylglycinamide formyltransferase 1